MAELSGRDILTRDASSPSGSPAPGTPPPLELRLFGPLGVWVAGAPLPRLRSRKGLWLLALLALRGGRGVDRDWVAGTLWPDNDEADARHSLRQSLYDLRVALGPEARRLGSAEPRTLRLAVDGAAVDALAFDAALGRGDLASLEAAAQLYRGPLLEDCAEEWALEERRRREEQYLAALEALATAALAQKEYASAARYLRLVVGPDPFREDAQRALMHALDAGGNPAGALLVYRRFRELLWRETTTQPTEETTALFRRLRAEGRERPDAPGLPDPSAMAGPPSPHPFPVALTPLIGRDEAVRTVAARLAHAPLVTLTGAGGIGKTRLALAVAESVASQYADGVRFVPLAALADPTVVPDAVLAALGGTRSETGRAASEVLKESLASRRLLLVLDNCEHLLDGCAALADALLCYCPGLRVLATSRQPLGLHGETIWRVPSLGLPPEDPGRSGHPGRSGALGRRDEQSRHGDALEEYAAVRLFVERARAAEARFTLTPESAPVVAAICRRLDGIPLAIELAAARVRSLAVEDIHGRLAGGFGLLTGGGRTLLARQQTLAATFDWGWELLSAPERALLARLSVFAGGWTLEAAEAVCPDGAAVGAGDVVDLLTALVDKSLVVFRPAGDGTDARYSLLETVRQYAGERLAEREDSDAARDRHLDYFLAWAERAKPKFNGPEQSLWLDRAEVEHDNLRAALRWCERGPSAEAGLRLARALWRFWYVRGYLSEGRQWLERLLARDAALAGESGSAPSAARARALTAAGNLAQLQGDHGPARAHYEECLALQRRLGDKIEVANACNNLGILLQNEGDYAMAKALFEESLAVFRRAGRRQAVANGLGNLGLIAYEQGDYAAARPLWEESLALEREMDNPAGVAASLGCLGLLDDVVGDSHAARAAMEECLALFRALGDRLGMAQALLNLGSAACRRSDLAEAQSLFAESLAIGRQMGSLRTVAHSLDGLALLARHQVQPARAVRLLGSAQALRAAIGSPRSPAQRREHEAEVAALRDALGGQDFDAIFAVGRATPWEQLTA